MKTDSHIQDHFSHPSKWMMNIIHIVACGILLIAPFFFTGKTSQDFTIIGYIRSIIVPLSFICVFYINYFLLINRYLFKHHTFKFLISNFLLIVFAIITVHLLMESLPRPIGNMLPPPPPMRRLPGTVGFYIINAVIYALIAGLSVAIKMTINWQEVEFMHKELEKNRTEAELQNLKSQLNPHFLFNTLNNIYSLINFSPDRAQEAIHDLSRLLRYVLYESSQMYVSLESEVNFIRNYVELMKIRLPENAECKSEIHVLNPEIKIAPLLFISLIENAFKHGISNSQPSFLDVSITQIDKTIKCAISNTYFPKDTNDKSGSGIGISNLHKRLDLIYPDRYNFRYGVDGNKYCSVLEIELI